MLIDEIANVLWRKRNALVNKKDYNPKLVVYMSDEFYCDCCAEIRGQVSDVCYEFSRHNTILGYSVYRVIGGKHPNFLILEV